MQRFFDFIFSSLALIFLLPLFFLIAVMLRVTGEGEILFKQKRIGKDGNLFQLIKFATMLKNSPNMATGTITVNCDPRILPFGKILRKTKINELPQLINVLLGDMSIVGPRPLTHQTFDAYTPEVQKKIKAIVPGLSGIGSIIFRNEENILGADSDPKYFYNSVVAPYKGSLEVWYAENRSLKNYFLVIFATLAAVINPRTSIVWLIFSDLPIPPSRLKEFLNIPEKCRNE